MCCGRRRWAWWRWRRSAAGGRRAGLRNLALAVLVLLMLDPFLSRSVGFALSVLASGGIIWWARSWALVLNRRLPLIIAEAMTVPLAAHLVDSAGGGGDLGSGQRVGVGGQCAGRSFRGAGDGPRFRRGRAVVDQFLAGGGRRLGSGVVRSSDHLDRPRRCGPARVVVALAGDRRWPGWPRCGRAGDRIRAARGSPVIGGGRWVPRCRLVAGTLTSPVQPGWPPRDWDLVACSVGQGDGLVLRAGPGQASWSTSDRTHGDATVPVGCASSRADLS